MEEVGIIKLFTEYAFTQGVLGFTTLLFLCLFLLSHHGRGKDRKRYDSDIAHMRKEFEALTEKRLAEYQKVIDAITDLTATQKIQFAVQANVAQVKERA